MFARKKVDGRHNLQRLIPNTGWLLFDKILRLGVGLFVSVWTVRSLGAVSNIVLNLLLIPRYGGLGAAIATTISYALSAVILNAFSAKTRKIFALQLASIIPVFPGNR
jgi:O-antigen/teichoic acid export membrane protein